MDLSGLKIYSQRNPTFQNWKKFPIWPPIQHLSYSEWLFNGYSSMLFLVLRIHKAPVRDSAKKPRRV